MRATRRLKAASFDPIAAGYRQAAARIDVKTRGALQPGLTSEEAAALSTDDPGNVLHAGGNVRLGGASRLVVPVRSANDYGKLRADGDLVLGGELVLDLAGRT